MFGFKKRKNENIVKTVYKKDFLFRCFEFILGVLVTALAYNIFVFPADVVYGVGGIGVIFNKLFGISPSLVILIGSLVLLMFSFILLGKEKTRNSVIGSILYPIFVKLTEWVPQYIDLNAADPIVIVIVGAVLTGFGIGLVFKSGYTTGGTDILNQIVSKYGKMSIGNAMLLTDGAIILASGFVFGWLKLIYSLISLYIISLMSDKVILGISQSKAFYIITNSETEVKKFLLTNLAHGITVFDVRGGYTGNNQKMIMCILPTKEYFLAKEGILEIDPTAFFVVTDAYEVRGGE